MKVANRAEMSQKAIIAIVVAVIIGLDIKISEVTISPRDIPVPKLENNTMAH